jgi:hypothetical protein
MHMPGAYHVNLKPRLSRDGNLTLTQNGWRLTIPAGPAGKYRLSQLDDHAHMPRRIYPWHPTLTMSLRARMNNASASGTWGFGFWNDPFGFSFGPGDEFFRLPALPNTVWFFFASPNNYLSFRNDKPAHGFLAQSFRSPSFHPMLFLAGLTLPFSRKTTRRVLSRVIEEDSATVTTDVTQWHDYRIEWSPTRSQFWVDTAPVLDSPVSPHSPLGLVIWVDNQYAAFTPEGRIKWGLVENSKSDWLEIERLSIE